MLTMCHVTENFKRLCLIRADLSKVSESTARGMMGEVHVKEYKIILRFGAELQAQLSWLEDVSARTFASYASSNTPPMIGEGEEVRSCLLHSYHSG